jgi:hypothetical protein
VAKTLVIDPVLVYSTYLGGSLGDNARAIAVAEGDLCGAVELVARVVFLISLMGLFIEWSLFWQENPPKLQSKSSRRV